MNKHSTVPRRQKSRLCRVRFAARSLGTSQAHLSSGNGAVGLLFLQDYFSEIRLLGPWGSISELRDWSEAYLAIREIYMQTRFEKDRKRLCRKRRRVSLPLCPMGRLNLYLSHTTDPVLSFLLGLIYGFPFGSKQVCELWPQIIFLPSFILNFGSWLSAHTGGIRVKEMAFISYFCY